MRFPNGDTELSQSVKDGLAAMFAGEVNDHGYIGKGMGLVSTQSQQPPKALKDQPRIGSGTGR